MANNKDFIVKNGLTVGTDATITNSLFVPNIDTTDSSAISITPSAIFSSDVTVENNLYANNDVTIGNELTVTTGLFTPLIDTADSSTLTITPAAVFNSDVTVENNLYANNDVTANRFFGDGSALTNITALAAIVGRTEEFPTITDGSPTVTMGSAYNIDALDVFLNGVRLRPYTDYTVSGTTLTFSENLGSQDIVALYIFDYATKTEEFPTVTNGSANVTLEGTYVLSQLDVYLNGSKLKPTTDFTVSGTTLTFANALATGDVVSVVVYSGAGVDGGDASSFADLSDVNVAFQATNTLIKWDSNKYVPTSLSEDSSGNVTVAGELYVSTIDTTDSSALTITPDVVMSAGLTVGNHIVPSSNENIDLGSASFRFRDLYLSGESIDLGGVQITKSGSSVALPAGSTIGGLDVAVKDISGNLTYADNEKAIFGTSSDLEIYHDGTDSYISDQGTGSLKILTSFFAVKNGSDTEQFLNATNNGAVKLFYDNGIKIETTSTGAQITDTLLLGTDDTSKGLLSVYGDTTGQFGGGEIQLYTSADYDTNIEYWKLQPRGEDFVIEKDDETDFLRLDYSNNYVDMPLGKLEVGTVDSTYGEIRVYGDGTGSSQGALIRMYTAADYDTSIDFYNMKVTSDDWHLEKGTGEDIISYFGGTNELRFGSTLAYVSVGASDSSKGSLYLWSDGAGSVNGGELRIYNAPDHDTTVNYYSLYAESEDFLISYASTDFLQYQVSTSQWKMPQSGGLSVTGNVTVNGQLETSTIDTADSSALTVTPAVVFSSDVNIENSLRVNKITSTDSSALEVQIATQFSSDVNIENSLRVNKITTTDSSALKVQIATQFSSDVTVDQDVTANRYFGDGSNLTGIGATGAGGDEIFWENGQTITTNYTITTNKNAMTAGPVTLNTGITVTIPEGSSWIIL